jgi:hypothetical protein
MVWMFVSSKRLEEMSDRPANFSTMGIIMAVIMVFSVLISYIFNNFILVNQGLIYYSVLEEKENNSSKNLIDQIGTDIE